MRAHNPRPDLFAAKHTLHNKGVRPLYDTHFAYSARYRVGRRVQLGLHSAGGYPGIDQVPALPDAAGQRYLSEVRLQVRDPEPGTDGARTD